ncbi:hypothetical protein RND71_018641 [Anisodus tanguticus]|uniref:Alpha-D-phosphohexomutase alpha/beta/alpha domain-containing protein n=1 Tax=Anisodus tanguticus TaxID=243964 RepID=A0AAE1VKE4_9SOLA|nr:hypothetical protein RND71_018641 [Anisodus tanguticus]
MFPPVKKKRSVPFVVNATSSSPSPPSTTIAQSQALKINSVPTKPIEGQKTGTSGLPKKVKVFMQDNYLANWIQALFNSLPLEDYKNGLLVLGGDGDILIEKLHRDGILSTPAVSAVIPKRVNPQANGGFIMSASHNPGGPEYDGGIKFNYSSGQPAPESITDKIYENTLSISEIKIADIPDVDLSQLGVTKYGGFSVEVVDPVDDYLELMENVFDFSLIRSLVSRPDFSQKEVDQTGNKRAKWVYTINLTGTLLTISRHDLVLLQIQDRTTCTTTTGICGMRVSGLGLDGGSRSSSSSSSLRCYIGYALI